MKTRITSVLALGDAKDKDRKGTSRGLADVPTIETNQLYLPNDVELLSNVNDASCARINQVELLTK